MTGDSKQEPLLSIVGVVGAIAVVLGVIFLGLFLIVGGAGGESESPNAYVGYSVSDETMVLTWIDADGMLAGYSGGETTADGVEVVVNGERVHYLSERGESVTVRHLQEGDEVYAVAVLEGKQVVVGGYDWP